MLKARKTTLILTVAILFAGTCFAEGLKSDLNDFLHYTALRRFKLAKAYAQKIIESEPSPVELLTLLEENPRGYDLLERVKENKYDAEMAQLSTKLWGIVEQGRFIRRTDPKIIVAEVNRLSVSERGYHTAVKRLRNAGEYSIPFMLDVLFDRDRQEEWPNIISALPKIGKDAIRPLAAALATSDAAVKAHVINTLGQIKYPQALAYLKFTSEKETSPDLQRLAVENISLINPAAVQTASSQLFYSLAQNYYYHAESLDPDQKVNFANVWFWDEQSKRLKSERVDRGYFFELMSMRCCEWALKADENYGPAIGLWIAAFFKAESANPQMPVYFGETHADAFTYATTAGPEYLQQALARAVADKNAHVALGVVEALAVNAGEQALMYRVGTVQPLVQALSFNDKAVRFSAAIAIGAAGPRQDFAEKSLVTSNLAEALGQKAQDVDPSDKRWNVELANSYALRSAQVMLKLAQTRNPVINLALAQEALITATRSPRAEIQVLGAHVLAHINSPGAQHGVAVMALDQNNSVELRINAFAALAVSAKLNANLLSAQAIDAIYALVGSDQTDPKLRAAAAAAYGALKN
ncbi:MAG: HEAT repeat domain-containing protein [Planctomycetota bacterium]|jgi:hypothetical protein